MCEVGSAAVSIAEGVVCHPAAGLFGTPDHNVCRIRPGADIAAPLQDPRGITTADVNNDGRWDVIYTGFATGTVQVLINRGAGQFSAGPSATAAGTQPQGAATAGFKS